MNTVLFNAGISTNAAIKLENTNKFSVLNVDELIAAAAAATATAAKNNNNNTSVEKPVNIEKKEQTKTPKISSSSTASTTSLITDVEQIEKILLQYINENQQDEIQDSANFAADVIHCDSGLLNGVLLSLEGDKYVEIKPISQSYYALTEEGLNNVKAGASPEFIVLSQIKNAGDTGLKVGDIQKDPILGVGYMQCMKNRWITFDKASGLAKYTATTNPVDIVLDQLRILLEQEGAQTSISDEDAKNLSKRKLIKTMTRKSFSVKKGINFKPIRVRPEAELTKELLDGDAYKNVQFKSYNFNSMGAQVSGGYLHPLLQVRNEFRKILIGMGFEEMPTNQWVESSFWNFDALFQPQQHPARDAHDTFFISTPEIAGLQSVNKEYIEAVRKVHEGGGYGSKGYQYNWSENESRKNILRTHTTAVSSKMLYALANQPGGFKPKKFFSIDRVFRNEDIDKTHLAEFHQVEGLVADYNLTLGSLIGTIKTFFQAIGIHQMRFKAAYNPYTEPSMEIFGYHPQLKKWTEIGNSGMFRPEMLRPMGLPEGVRVIAWGLSLERPTMIMTGENHIKNLFGSQVSLEMLRSFAFPRFTKVSSSSTSSSEEVKDQIKHE